ncbi:Dyp-type peroxidase [Brachybacterium sp. AOP25-B2-12]|uniref:Dyp-type peroxidase n=1 Tax=Brachybacterium sp. AOP25-B2-12 TaxID=3457710 RepID=UPI004034241F
MHSTDDPQATTPEGPAGPGPDPSGTAADAHDPGTPAEGDAPRAVGRRGILGAAGASLLTGGALGFVGGRAVAASAPSANPLETVHPFRGEHQQGITTPAQDYLFAAAYDLTTSDIGDLRDLMGQWSVAAEQMTRGELVGERPLANLQAAPLDTGEAWGYPASSLTITVGVGPTLFRTADGVDRYGLAARETEVLGQGIPRFANESMQDARSGGDIIVQACADDAQVAVHAIRNLTRIAMGTAALRWSQVGHGRTSSTSTQQETPRNLFGFKDGTLNLKAEDGAEELGEHLWVGSGDQGGDWLAGGSYLVFRKIRMRLESWDRLRLVEQQDIMGRDKRYGAPLSVSDPTAGSQEFTAPDYAAKTGGRPSIPADAHIRLVAPEHNDGARMLRRGYNYTEGSNALGQIDGGLFFEAFVRDPRTGFYPVLDKMSRADPMNEYIQHIATGVYAILPGVREGESRFGQSLLG